MFEYTITRPHVAIYVALFWILRYTYVSLGYSTPTLM